MKNKLVTWFISVLLIGLLVWINHVIKVDLFLRLINPLILGCFLCLYRIISGPTAADRAVSVDTMGIMIIGFCGVLAFCTKQDFLIDIALAWGLQSFIASLALAKYMEGHSLDD
ncbi:MAG: monovalent cation/H+ antiporter complex subunit F [Elusimicrobiota bacterium]